MRVRPDRGSFERMARGFALAPVWTELLADVSTPVGVFRAVERPVYDELLQGQIDDATQKSGTGDLAALLHSGDTWTID